MKRLSISEALQLYQYLGKYIPEDAENDLEFIGTIVHNIKNGDNPRDYVDALSLLTGFSVDDIVTNLSPEEGLKLFYDGLTENDVVNLKKFCDRLRYG